MSSAQGSGNQGAAMALVCTALAFAGTASCANLGTYVWVDQYAEPPAPVKKPFVIAFGDVIKVTVFNQEQLSVRMRVRSDGKVTLPLLGDVVAEGYTPADLSHLLENRLKEFVKNPAVTVSIEETKQQTFMVIGEVVRPNSYALEAGIGVLQALAIAGGLTPDASTGRIFVLRQNPSRARIRFTYEALVHQQGRAATFELRPGDVVVVE